MKIIECVQGDGLWHQVRAKHYCASDMPAIMGVSSYKTRSTFLREKATGITEEITPNKQALFDRGHAAEEVARGLAEDFLQEDLAPVVGSIEVAGLPLLASMDGLNFEGTIILECKLWSEKIAAMIEAGEVAASHYWQLEAQLLVSGAERVLFVGCDGEKINGQIWYESKPERRAALIAGIRQFDEDLRNYKPAEILPATVAERPAELPALDIQIVGNVVASNLAQWRDVVKERIAAINTNLTTDQEFSDAKAMVKFLDDGEKRIELVKSQVLAQAVDINAVLSAMDEIKETMRSKRLGLDKTVKAREESIKIEIMQAGKDQLAAHIAGLNKRLAKVQMPPIAADWPTATKGKRNLESMRGAVADLVAAKKIESNEIADRISINLDTLAKLSREDNADYSFLFHDFGYLVSKAPDDMELLARSRIANHKAEEAKRLEAERQKIRAEEEAKAAAKVKAEQDEADRQRKAGEEAAAKVMSDRATEAAMEEHRTLEKARALYTEPAAPAAPGASSPRLDETPRAAAPTHKGVTGTAKLRDEIDDLLIDFDAVELIAAIQSLRSIKARRDTRAAA